MKKFRILALLLVLTLSLGLVVGCEKPAENKEAEAPTQSTEEVKEGDKEEAKEDGAFTVVDMTGREVAFEKTAEKVVAITPSDAENLNAIGAVDSLVGIGTYVDNPEEILSLPVVASGSDLNAEEIIALEPDLVLMSDMAQSEEQIKALSDAGVNVVVTKAGTIEEVYKALELIGKVMGKEEDAAKVIENMKDSFKAIEANKENLAGKKIYFEVSPLEYGLWSAGAHTFMDEIAQIVGLENIFADIEGWSEVSEEEVIARNPDYIVTISMGSMEGPSPVEEIIGRPGWEEIIAVKEGKILNLVDNELSRPSVRLVQGAEALNDFVNQ